MTYINSKGICVILDAILYAILDAILEAILDAIYDSILRNTFHLLRFVLDIYLSFSMSSRTIKTVKNMYLSYFSIVWNYGVGILKQ
jgi:hypothetical protein